MCFKRSIQSTLLGLLALGALCVTSARASAQQPQLFELHGQYVAPVELASAGRTRAQVTSYEAVLNVPIPLSARTFLIPGLGYHADAIAYARVAPGVDALRLFHAVELSILLVQLLPRALSLSLRVAPALAGDFASIDKGLLRSSALALLTKSFSPSFVLGGGALASFSFGAFLPLPALYVSYQPRARLSLESFLPAFAQLTYLPWPRLELALRAEVSGNAYAVRAARVREAPPCAAAARQDGTSTAPAAPARCLDHLAYSVVTAGLSVGVRVVSSLWISLFAGRTLYRRLEPMNDQDRPLAGQSERLPNSFTAKGSLVYRMPQG